MSPFELTRRLMAIPSPTGSELQIGQFLASHLTELGYRVETQKVSDNRLNVRAFAGDAQVMLCTHIDTVTPELPVSEDDGFIHGRGACDTKGIIAAMIEAGDRLRRERVTQFGFLFVVGEETDGIGAKTANQLEWSTSFVIVGEPTENHLAVAQKGTLMADLSVQGKAAHSGYPHLGDSAILKLWAVLADCEKADWGEDPVLGRGTCNIGVFHGGDKANIVPASAAASIMLRTVEPRPAAEARFRSVVGDRAGISVTAGASPQFMHVVDGFPTTVVSFGSDVPYLTRLGKPLLIGPGSILDAHTAHERISKEDLLQGAANYAALVKRLLN